MPNTRVPAIQQRLRADAESICFKCFHRKVCRAIDNQPCIECNQFTDANGVTVQEWISVSEGLPEEDVRVLVHINPNSKWNTEVRLDTDRRHKNSWVRWGEAITHWMPLPEAPKGE